MLSVFGLLGLRSLTASYESSKPCAREAILFIRYPLSLIVIVSFIRYVKQLTIASNVDSTVSSSICTLKFIGIRNILNNICVNRGSPLWL